MRITIRLSTHVYAEEKMVDDIYLDKSLRDSVDTCGILGPEVIVPLRRNILREMFFEYDENTTLADFECFIKNIIQIPSESGKIAFFSGPVRYWVDNSNAKFAKAISNFDCYATRVLEVGLYVSMDAGAICEEDGIRYYMNSRERGKHHEPHIHLRSLDSCEEAVIIIKTREVIGDFPRKLIKKARKKVEKNERFFLEQWNVLTDGLKVDINRYFGLINY